MKETAWKVGDQKMSDLPKNRCCEAVLFTHYGVVMFGPVIIKERRSNPKQYCAYSHVPLVQQFILRYLAQ